MNEEILKDLITARFGDKVTITSFNIKDSRLPLHDNDDCSWRDYLLDSFGLRLNHGDKKDIDPVIIDETKSFIKELRKMPNDALLIIWQAKSATRRYMGWASEEKLIYAQQL